MSKVLATAAMVVGAVALVATGVGALAFGTTLAAAAASTSVAIGGLSISVGTLIAVSSGLSVAAALTAKRPSIGTSGGSQTAFKANPDAGLPYAIGKTFPYAGIVFRGGGAL